MVSNEYYKCGVCGSKLRFRYQIGAFNIPISIYCPKCNCHIEGMMYIDNEKCETHSFVFGAEKYLPSNDFADYICELSTEFLVKKAQKDYEGNFDISMFLRSNPLNNDKNERRIKLLNAVAVKNIYTNIIENIYSLLENNQIDLLKSYLLDNCNKYFEGLAEHYPIENVNNKLDAMLASKHFINTLLIPFMTKGTFENIYSIMNTKVRRIIARHMSALKEYLEHLSESYYDIYVSRIPQFIIDYLKIANQLVPVYDSYETFDSIDLNEYGASTISVGDIVVVYKKGYELICDSIDLLIGLYNIENNGTYDNFGSKLFDFDSKVNSFGSKYKKYEYATNNSSDLYDGIRNILDREIRNAEGHNSITIDGLKQVVTFIDKHSRKELSFIELGKNCIDVFNAVLYLWEYYYQIVKLKSVIVEKTPLNYGIKK